MLEEIRNEAARLDRSLSWIVQRAWKVAREASTASASQKAPIPARVTPEQQG
jgi:uncharacterized small protein (TIGR04563 family)